MLFEPKAGLGSLADVVAKLELQARLSALSLVLLVRQLGHREGARAGSARTRARLPEAADKMCGEAKRLRRCKLRRLATQPRTPARPAPAPQERLLALPSISQYQFGPVFHWLTKPSVLLKFRKSRILHGGILPPHRLSHPPGYGTPSAYRRRGLWHSPSGGLAPGILSQHQLLVWRRRRLWVVFSHAVRPPPSPARPEHAHPPSHHQRHGSPAPRDPARPPPDALRRAERWQGFTHIRPPRTTRRAASAAPQAPRRPFLGTPRTAPIPGAFQSTNIHPFIHLHPQTLRSTATTTCAKPPTPHTPDGQPPAPQLGAKVGGKCSLGVPTCVRACLSSFLSFVVISPAAPHNRSFERRLGAFWGSAGGAVCRQNSFCAAVRRLHSCTQSCCEAWNSWIGSRRAREATARRNRA